MTGIPSLLTPTVDRNPRGHAWSAWLRHHGWRSLLNVTGGFATTGHLPVGACVIVANHNSHADTAALLAAIPTRSRPVVAAAADYWMKDTIRAAACRGLASGFPVRREGGGSADLEAARALLVQGRAVVVFPEGTRSSDGRVGTFHSGAFRLAAGAGVPLVPAGIVGTRQLLAPHGAPRIASVAVHFGTPVLDASPDKMRDEVERLSAFPPERGDSVVRQRVAMFAHSRWALLLVFCWALMEALVWPLVPELLLVALVVAAPRRWCALAGAAVAGSLAGGLLGFQLAVGGVTLPQPLTTARMHAIVAAEIRDEGAAAVRHQPLSGIPYKVYVSKSGSGGVAVGRFAVESLVARGSRIALVCLLIALLGLSLRRLRRFYPLAIGVGAAGFLIGLAQVVSVWS
jgi:1-acyl-sn-glycerol-3-phosphate acyltransferase